jgi:hypothetical protein
MLSVPYALHAKTAENGLPGEKGKDGQDGTNGKSAYQIYAENNTDPDLSETEWLASLNGEDGQNGENGKSAYQIYTENNTNPDLSETEWLASLKGEKGADGEGNGTGKNGKSAYEIYAENNSDPDLSETQWLASLNGQDGQNGKNGENGKSAYQIYADNNTDPDLSETDWLASLNGEDGQNGENGKSAYQIYTENNTDSDLSETEWLGSLKGEKGADGELPETSTQGSYLVWNSTNESWVVGTDKLTLGTDAGKTEQGPFTVALGYGAGSYNQGGQAVAIGALAGNTAQGDDAIALGRRAGNDTQATYAIAIGYLAGANTQAQESIAIGHRAGATNQGKNAVAIGSYAGRNNQHENSIVLNATGANLDTEASNTLYIAPVRFTTNSAETTNLVYNATTKEVSTDTAMADALAALQEKVTALEAIANQLAPSSFLRQANIPKLSTRVPDGKIFIDYITATSNETDNEEAVSADQDYEITINEVGDDLDLNAIAFIGTETTRSAQSAELDESYPLIAYITGGPDFPQSGVHVDVWITIETLTSSELITGSTTLKLSFGATKNWIQRCFEENGYQYTGGSYPNGIPLFLPVNPQR